MQRGAVKAWRLFAVRNVATWSVSPYLVPGLIVLLATALRLPGLDSQSLWQDELATLLYITPDKSWLETIYRPLLAPALPILPFHFLVVRPFTLLGYSDFLLRFPSAIFSILTIPLIYVLGRTFFNKRVGLVGALLVAISALDIRYAQEARSYTMATFFCCLSLYFFWQALTHTRWRLWLGFALSSVASLYSHWFGVLALGVMVLFALWLVVFRRDRARFRFQPRHFWLALVIVALAWSPLIAFILKARTGGGALSATGETVFPGLQLNLESGYTFLRLFGGGTDVGAALLASLFVVGIVALALRRRETCVLLLAWILVPVLSVLSLPFEHRVVIRYFLFTLPPYLLVVAYGLQVAIRTLSQFLARLDRVSIPRPVAQAVLAVILLGAMAASAVPALASYHAETKQDWRGVTDLLQGLARPGDRIYVDEIRYLLGIELYSQQFSSAAPGEPFDLHRLPNDPLATFSHRRNIHGWLVAPFRMSYLPDGDLARQASAYHFSPPIILGSVELPPGAEKIAPVSFEKLMLIRFTPAEKTQDECYRQQFLNWLQVGRELGVDSINLDLSLALFAAYCGDPATAATRLASIPKTGYGSAYLYSLQGNAYEQAGQWDEAIDAYQRAVALNPDYTWLEVKAANLYRQLGDLEEAEASYLRALDNDAGLAGAHFELAGLYEETGRLDLALEEYRRASELRPQEPGYHASLGRTYAQLERMEEALVSFDRAVELAPDNAWYHQLLANTLLALGQAKEAADEYEQALTLNPEYRQNTWLQLQRADAYRLAGRIDEAIAAYEQVLALDEDNARAAKWLAELE